MLKRFSCLTILALVLSASQAGAQTYWVIENTTDQLCRIDVNTLQGTVVGPLGVNWSFGGIGFAPNGTLYGWDSVPNRLYRINTSTGSATLIGTGSAFGMDSFDINPVTGRAYGVAGADLNSVQEINLTTGATTFIAYTNPSTGVPASAFNATGTWFALNGGPTLSTINLNNGSVTTIGSTGLGGNITNMGFNFADNQLYAMRVIDPNFPLFRIDPSTAVSTFVGNVTGLPGGANQQITAGTFQFVAVPEPTTIGFCGLAIIGIGYWRWKKCRVEKADLETEVETNIS